LPASGVKLRRFGQRGKGGPGECAAAAYSRKNRYKSAPKTIEASDWRAAVANWTNTDISLLLGPRRRGREEKHVWAATG
jgi:hypothetical protein